MKRLAGHVRGGPPSPDFGGADATAEVAPATRMSAPARRRCSGKRHLHWDDLFLGNPKAKLPCVVVTPRQDSAIARRGQRVGVACTQGDDATQPRDLHGGGAVEGGA